MAIPDETFYKVARRRLDELEAFPDDLKVQALTHEEAAYEAIVEGNLSRIWELIADGLDTSVRTLRWIKGRNTRFPFHIHIHHTMVHVAIMCRHYEIANVLLDAGADPLEKHMGVLPYDLFGEYTRWQRNFDTGQLLVPFEEYRLGRRLLYYTCVGNKNFAGRYPLTFRQSLIDQGPDSIAEIIPGKRGIRPIMP